MALFKNLRELLGVKSRTTPNSEDMCLCMVVSEQEGAEIWIEGRKTNYLTPKLVAIPKNQVVDIEIRLVGHKSHKAQVRSAHNLTYYYCNLTRVPLKLIPGGASQLEAQPSV